MYFISGGKKRNKAALCVQLQNNLQGTLSENKVLNCVIKMLQLVV